MDITTVSVKFSRKVDLGYKPYVEYLRTLGNRTAPFGTRDNANLEFDVFISATLKEGEDLDECVAELAKRARANMNEALAEIIGLPVASQDNDAYVVDKIVVERVVEEV